MNQIRKSRFGIREQKEHTDTKERVHYQQVSKLKRDLEFENRVLTRKVPGGPKFFFNFPESPGLGEHVGTKISFCAPKKSGFLLQATVTSKMNKFRSRPHIFEHTVSNQNNCHSDRRSWTWNRRVSSSF